MLRNELTEKMKNNGVKSMVTIRCWWDFPLILMSILIARHIATAHPSLLTHGGIWWFEDLSQMDFFARFNLLAAIGSLTSFELGAEVGPHVRRRGLARAFVYTSTLVFFVYLYFSPMSSHLVWCAAAWSSVSIGLILRNSRVKKFLNFPEPVYRDTWSHNPADTVIDRKK
jgi:hypothetical protein